MPTLSYNTGTFRYDPSSQIALMDARQRIWEEEQRRKRQTARDILEPIQQKIRQRKEERERDRRQQMEQEQWQYRFDQESQRRQQELEFRYPALAEIQRIDKRLGDIERAKTDLMSRDIYGPVMTGMPGDMVNNSTIRDAGLKALEQEEAALRRRREELMGAIGGSRGRVYGDPVFATTPSGVRYGYIPGSSSFQFEPGQSTPSGITPTRENMNWMDALAAAQWEVENKGLPPQYMHIRARQYDALFNRKEPLPPLPEKTSWFRDKRDWDAWAAQYGGTQPEPSNPVDGASEATLTPKQEWISAIAVTGDPAEFDALERVYSMVMEQGLSVDDPRVSPIIDALPEATQRNLARSLAAHGKL